MAHFEARPPTVSVEKALNSRVSSDIDGPHHGVSIAGQALELETVGWVGWAGHRTHGLCPEIRLRTYILTPTGNYEYEPETHALQVCRLAFNEVFAPSETDGGICVLQTLEDLDTRRTGEYPFFDALWKLGTAYQAIALLCAGLQPRPLACTNWSATKWQPSGWPRVRIVSRPRELAFQTIRVTDMAPSWPEEQFFAPGLHPKWQSDPACDDPRTDAALPISDAMADFSWYGEFSDEPLGRKELSQLLWGTCGTTSHDILGGQWGRFKRMTRCFGTPYSAAGGHYYIRTDTAQALAYVVDREGLLKYVSISPQGLPTSSFARMITDDDLLRRLERALGVPDGFCPQYIVLNDYRGDWEELESESHRWFDLAEAGSMEYCLRMQAYALDLGVKTFLLNGVEKREALVEACRTLAFPVGIIAVGHGTGQAESPRETA